MNITKPRRIRRTHSEEFKRSLIEVCGEPGASVAGVPWRTGLMPILAHVVQIFGEARPHYAYLFANRRGARMKVLIHYGQGIWLACRRLHQGRFR